MSLHQRPAETPGYDAIGTVVKAHGLKGEMAIRVELPYPEQLEDLDLLFIHDGKGLIQPFRIMSGKVASMPGKDLFFVKLESVADRAAATTMIGRHILVPEESVDLFDDADDDASLSGYTAIGLNGQPVGEVIDVMENPAHPLLQIKIPGTGMVLVPMVDAYVTDIDDDAQTIHLNDIEALMEI